MAAATASRRGRQQAAAQRAAKERRQLILVIGLAVALVIVLAIELPGLLNRGGGSSSSAPSASTTPSTTATTAGVSGTATPGTVTSKAVAAARRKIEKGAQHDVFTVLQITSSSNTLGSIPNPPGLHDPFASPSAPESAVAPPAPKAPKPAITGTIVIGKPGAGTVAVHGWIVILASIPTAQGKASASKLQAVAGKAGFGAVSVLNSSNRKPLRGGYWVVYTGPFSGLPEANTNAASVHSHGFTTAYIRQLIVYKKKSK